MAKRGVPLAEVNLDTSGATGMCDYIFQAGLSLPADLDWVVVFCLHILYMFASGYSIVRHSDGAAS